MPVTVFGAGLPIIDVLHLPDFALSRHRTMAWLEDYALANASVLATAGVPCIKLQDQTRTAGTAAPDTLSIMVALGRLIWTEFPKLELGIISEAHDPAAELSVANAAGANFVRLKVFVGGAMTANGARQGLCASAVAHRVQLVRRGIAILADIHNRTARPLSDETQPLAAQWAEKVGADGLIITGSDFADSLTRIAAVRRTVPSRTLLIGGGVTEANVAEALAASDGVIVSAAFMRTNAAEDDLVRWDADQCQRFMDAARAA
ncbi:MAG: BtpA/SgcQ family protein [Geminicoccaceae bacterium]